MRLKYDQADYNLDKIICKYLFDSLDCIITIAESESDNFIKKGFGIIDQISATNSILISKFATLNNSQWLNGENFPRVSAAGSKYFDFLLYS